jgi:hypothetical protein
MVRAIGVNDAMRIAHLRILSVVAAFLLASVPATAKKCEIADLSSEAARLEAAKCFKFQADTRGLKKGGLPRKIAVGSFLVVYHLRSQEYGLISDFGSDVRSIGIAFADEVYQDLTNRLYDRFVERMAAQGFEIAKVEDVVATEVYERIEADSDAVKKGAKVRFAPYGLKNVKLGGAIAGQKHLPGINKALGTDAVATVRLELSICAMSEGAFKKQRAGHLCIANLDPPAKQIGDAAPFSITFYGGFREGKLPGGKVLYQPEWQNGIVKGADPYVAYDEAVAPVVKRGLLDDVAHADQRAYFEAALGLLDFLVDVGVTNYKAQAE